MIVPTVGRVIWFHYNKEQVEPFPALVCKVNEDGTINVAGFTDTGVHFAQPNVPLIQDDEPAPERICYAEWMPYQKATAAVPVTNGVSGSAGNTKPL